MEPLTSWICDSCGDAITDPTKAMVAWKYGPGVTRHSFRIVHKGKTCDDRAFPMSMQLNEMLGLHGQTWLMSFLSAGPLMDPRSRTEPPVDFDQFVDLFRRLQMPWYEEARQFFSDPEVREEHSDSNEVLPYLTDELEHIARTHMVE